MANLYRASNPISNELHCVLPSDYLSQKGERGDPIVLDDDDDYDLSGGQSRSSSPVPGTRENPVVLDDDEDYDLSSGQSQSSSPVRGTRENPVVLENNEDHYQSQTICPAVQINDRDKFTCALCLDRDVNLSLRCGHIFCYTCINKWFHEVIYRLDAPQRYPVTAFCPGCRMKLFGCHTPPAYHKTREAMGFFSLTCPNAEHRDCFLEQYMVPGTQLKFL